MDHAVEYRLHDASDADDSPVINARIDLLSEPPDRQHTHVYQDIHGQLALGRTGGSVLGIQVVGTEQEAGGRLHGQTRQRIAAVGGWAGQNDARVPAELHQHREAAGLNVQPAADCLPENAALPRTYFMFSDPSSL